VAEGVEEEEEMKMRLEETISAHVDLQGRVLRRRLSALVVVSAREEVADLRAHTTARSLPLQPRSVFIPA
jgi:hypothetical protein